MEARTYRHVVVATEGGIATVALSNPARKNAISAAMVHELLWALDDAARDRAVRVLVLTGVGNAFSSGADLRELGATTDLPPKGSFADLLLRLVEFPKPTIARIPGPAVAGGLGLAAACHFAIACESAIFGTPEIKHGLFPMMIMSVLERVVPRRKLLELLLLGDRYTAREALELGLVGRVVPDAALDEAVAGLAARLAAAPEGAVQAGLGALRDLDRDRLDLAVALPRLEASLFALLGGRAPTTP